MLKDVERCGRFLLGFSGCTEDRFGQGPAVHLLVLVERYLGYLHRCGRHHVRRLAVEDEIIECLDVNLFVCHDVCGNVFSASRIVECLNCGILDAVELSDDSLDLLQLDAETAYLDLTVLASNEFDVAVFAITHDVTGTIDAFAVPIHKSRCCFLWLVQVTEAYLRPCNNQFAAATPWHLFPEAVDDIQFHGIVGLSDGDVGFVPIHIMTAYIAGRLGRTVCVEQTVGRRIKAHELLSSRSQPLEPGDVGIGKCHLSSHLRCHKAVGYALLGQVFV